MGEWIIEIELVGPLHPEQLEQAARGATLAHYSETTHVLLLRDRVDGPDLVDALRQARDWDTRHPGATALIRTGVLTGPTRVVIETATAPPRVPNLLGAAEIAERLGVTTARVRQLEQRPDFPPPALPLAGGRLYHADDIDRFNRGWVRTPGRPPRSTAS